MTIRQKSRRKWDDPMVTVSPPFLAAAVEASGLSVANIASRLGANENRQTLHAMMRGEEPKRCRQSRRQELARVLNVPENWLAGRLLANDPDAFPASVIGLLATATGLVLAPRILLAVMRLSERIERAARRDKVSPEPVFHLLEYVFLNQWRASLLVTRRGEPWDDIATSATNLKSFVQSLRVSPDAEDAARGIAKAIGFVLEPWFDGRAKLSPQALTLTSPFEASPADERGTSMQGRTV